MHESDSAGSRDFPVDFLFGSATASLQVEGGDTNNTWYRWCELGKIHDGTHCVRAVDHWNRVDQDIHLMLQLHQQTYRMSLEWSRIEPEPGVFSQEAVRHYRYELAALRTAGIRPLVTLHHFSLPLWFEDAGGWLQPEAPEIFLRYARFIATELIDLVQDWCTINEPNVYLLFGYALGQWPPGYRSIRGYFRAARQLMRIHGMTYQALHEIYRAHERPVQVGAAHHLRVYDPRSERSGPRRWVQAVLCRVLDTVTQWMFVRGMTTAGSQRTADYLGINYYTRDRISWSWNPFRLCTRQTVTAGAPVNDLGWEIYPEGLLRLLRRCSRAFPDLPLYITENGTCDAADRFRERYIIEHLQQVRQALQEGIPVQRYYHWSLMDNFEWLEGESARFGLIAVEYDTQKRRIRNSGFRYAEIARSGNIMYTEPDKPIL
ncbi:glycoside hydrolase family 1 protein [Spirochaeta africana]|uniref:Beta-glucosidase/6-phospho-beta-glucosidase/beta-galactosidase n=1 Tax=Spirochaeta africana (strain ATCC 700263 / DSM 8902 / Z-7692) TaxID=889378 RepID=H9UG19_SPIAZ|nr:family 1 glycosylhydrolase [Spirochaeta africana]AFG36462.1 beta-glucosidase/6-phospho-beta-glucosidase/beta-galactosidase [Spirochaeta africana DSM 8902]